jgi:hypothetical protein
VIIVDDKCHALMLSSCDYALVVVAAVAVVGAVSSICNMQLFFSRAVAPVRVQRSGKRRPWKYARCRNTSMPRSSATRRLTSPMVHVPGNNNATSAYFQTINDMSTIQ